MLKQLLSVSAIIILLFTSSCKKKVEKTEEEKRIETTLAIFRGEWKLVEYTKEINGVKTDLYSPLAACIKDDTYIMLIGTEQNRECDLLIQDKGLTCASSIPDRDKRKVFSLYGSQTILMQDNIENSKYRQYNIIKIDSKEFTVSDPFDKIYKKYINIR